MQLEILGKAINTLNTSKTAYTYFYKKYRIIQNYKSDKNVKPIKASIVNNLDLDLVKNNDFFFQIAATNMGHTLTNS